MIKMFRLLFLFTAMTTAFGCLRSEVLEPEPSSLDLDVLAPTCPGLTDATVTAGPSISLTWAQGSDQLTQASGITYSIFMKAGSQNYDTVSPTKIVIGATNTLITQGIQLGQTYTMYVTCKDEKGNVAPAGPWNERVVFVEDEIAPTPPSNLTVTNANYTSLLLTWGPADDGQGGTTSSQMKYRVYRSSTSPVATTGSPLVTVTSSTSYSDENLTPGTTYYYKVVAEDLPGNKSAASNEASGSTLTDSTSPTITPNLAASDITSTSLTLSWTAGSDNVTSPAQLVYRIFRCSGSTTCNPYANAFLAQTAPGQTSFNSTGLIPNTVYVFGVRAVDSSGNISTNAETLLTNTTYSNIGTFDFYPTPEEVGILLGHSVAVANVVGAATGAAAFPDLIVGAPNASEPGKDLVRTGCVYIFPGTAAGVFSITPTQTICQPNATGNGGNNRNFGTSMVAGDIDDNGTMDLVIGSPQQDRFFIFRSTNSGGFLSIGSNPTQYLRSGGTGFGTGLCLGNSDGVGGPDIFVTSPYENCDGGCSGFTGTGNVVLYTNISVGGSFTLPGFQSVFSPTNSLISSSYVLQSNERTVWSCSVGKFDPNNPTQEILVVGSPYFDHDNNTTANDGIVSFYRRTAANTWSYQNSLLAFVNNPPQLRDGWWGYSMTSLEVDGSGVPELFIGAPNDNSAGTGAGAIYGYSVNTLANQFVLDDLGTYYYGGSDQNSNNAGTGLAAGNIWAHSDSKQDLVIGAAWDDRQSIAAATAIDIGDVFTHKNNNGVITSAIQQKNFDISSVNARLDNTFGSSLCKGDVNNDGYIDVMVGSSLAENSQGQSYDPLSLTTATAQGALYVYYGRAMGEIDFANPSQLLFGPGNQSTAGFGRDCEVMDYNGDGAQDLLVGSPLRDVGANTDRGVIYVYFGSSNTPLLTTPSAALNAPVVQTNIYFGFSMSKGDIDGNGYDDLIVGSPFWDTGNTDTGGAWIFWANSTGEIQSTVYSTLLPPFGNTGSTGNPSLANNQMVGGRVTITSMARASNVVTVNTSGGHGLTAGMFVTIWNSMDNTFNGTYTVLAVPSGTQFTFSQVGVNRNALIISSMSRASNIVTVNTSGVHGLAVGNSVTISVPTTSFNGTFTVATVPSGSQFTFAQVGAAETATLNGNPYMQQQSSGGTIASISRSANVVTVTTNEPHGLCVGCNVGIWGSTSPSGNTVNWFWTVTAVVSSTVFRFNQTGPPEILGVISNNFYRRYLQSSSRFGWSVEAFPTVAGSNAKDVVVCAPWVDSDTQEIDSTLGALTDIGSCYVYEGGINGGFPAPQTYKVMTTPRNEIRFPYAATNWISSSLYFGTAMDRGDWDNDGVDDLAICAFRMRKLTLPEIANAGACFAYLGRTSSGISGGFNTVTGYRANFSGARTSPIADDVYYNFRSEANVTDFGNAVLLVDINNNSRADLLIGEPRSDNASGPANLGRDSGRVHVNRGEF
jgi:hypothetical protein